MVIFSARRLPAPWRRRQRSSPQRETCGLRNSRTASRSSSGKSKALRRATATACLAQASASSASGAACGSGRGRRRDPAISRPSARRSRSARPPARPVRCSPGSRPGSSVSWSPACAEKSACFHPLPNLAQDRPCHEEGRPARVYVIIRDGTARREVRTQTRAVEMPGPERGKGSRS